MRELKLLDYALLWELVKDSHRSDRQLAKVLGISQPTVTRRRAFMEKELIENYTAVPKWEKLGYTIFAITLVKIKPVAASKEEYSSTRKKGSEWLGSQHEIIMAGACRGMGVDSFMISLHKSYADYDQFMSDYRLEMAEYIDDVQSVIVNLAGKELIKPLSFKYLAETRGNLELH